MKKRIFSLVLVLTLIAGLLAALPVSGAASANQKYPQFPSDGQEYWVIFKEGYRNNRVEMSTCNISSDARNAYIVWNKSLLLKNADTEKISKPYNQYGLNDNSWEKIGAYNKFTDYAAEVIASNLDIYDSNGELLLEKTDYSSFLTAENEDSETDKTTVNFDKNKYNMKHLEDMVIYLNAEKMYFDRSDYDDAKKIKECFYKMVINPNKTEYLYSRYYRTDECYEYDWSDDYVNSLLKHQYASVYSADTFEKIFTDRFNFNASELSSLHREGEIFEIDNYTYGFYYDGCYYVSRDGGYGDIMCDISNYEILKDFGNEKYLFCFGIEWMTGDTEKVYVIAEETGEISSDVWKIYEVSTTKPSGANIDEDNNSFESNADESEFEVNKYRADFLLDSTVGICSTTIEKYFNDDTPASIFYETGKQNNLELSVDFWKTIQNADKMFDNPTKALDVAFDKKDMYEALLWNVFESSCNLDLLDEMDASINGSSKEVYDSITEYFKKVYNIDLAQKDSFKNMSSNEKKVFIEQLDEKFMLKYRNLDGVMRASDFIGDVSGAVSDSYTVCKAAAAYYKIYSLSDSIKQVMKEMYDKCPSDKVSLKAALLNCVTVMEANEKQFMADVAGMVVLNSGKYVSQACVGKLWGGLKDKIALAHPAVAVFMIAYEGSTFISNVAFNTDEIAECYSKIEAICDIKDTTIDAYNSLKRKYKSEKTEFNAEVYNSAIDILFSILDEECKISTDFVNSYEDSIDGSVRYIFGDKMTAERKRQINSIKDSYRQTHEAVLINWIFQLEEDNPEEYKKYNHLIDASKERIYKKYEISCPVNVFVYDQSNAVVGAVEDNEASVNGKADISVITAGDKKIIYLDDNKYKLKYEGCGSGSMNIKISEYKNRDNERMVYFKDLALNYGTVYTSNDDGRLSSDSYELKNDTMVIKPDFDTKIDLNKAIYNEILSVIGAKAGESDEDDGLFITSIRLTIGEKTTYINGNPFENDVAPIIKNDRTLLPIRLIAENLGASVGWDENSQMVSVIYISEDDKTDSELNLKIGDSQIEKITINYDEIIPNLTPEQLENGVNYEEIQKYAHNSKIYLDSPAIVMNDRAYLPVRAVAEALDASVEWNERLQEVTILKKEGGLFYKDCPELLNPAFYLNKAPIINNGNYSRYETFHYDYETEEMIYDDVEGIVKEYIRDLQEIGWIVTETYVTKYTYYYEINYDDIYVTVMANHNGYWDMNFNTRLSDYELSQVESDDYEE